MLEAKFGDEPLEIFYFITFTTGQFEYLLYYRLIF